ncbi:hypothetical protein C8Q80DRAFT_1221543 [Daedaleopsis nitida]|nr:hypothetical protein C8Q80DRAFT_1221543 [Daedaleopsis nitida]
MSGYKAWEYLLYVYGLLSSFLRHVQTPLYYQHFCLAVSSNLDLLPPARRNTIQYIGEYEDIYYQRRFDHLHFVCPSLHTFGHIIPEIFRVGPGALHTQWTMENYISNITHEIKQHVTPYTNVGERALWRCQINTLKAMLPDLAEPESQVSFGAMGLGSGYALLHATDHAEHGVTPAEAKAIHAYLLCQDVVLADPSWEPIVRRWARLAIPTQQATHSVWKEEAKERRGKQPRCSRMVKKFDTSSRWMMINSTTTGLAMVVPFSAPDASILECSRSTVAACTYPGADTCKVIPATQIVLVVAMVPLPMTALEASEADASEKYGNCYFVVEKPGLDIAQFAGHVEDGDEDEDGFNLD